LDSRDSIGGLFDKGLAITGLYCGRAGAGKARGKTIEKEVRLKW